MSVWKKNDVHVGFRKYSDFCKKKYNLTRVMEFYKDKTIYFCGHSLGATATTLLANDFATSHDVHLVLFGSPKLGGSNFSNAIRIKGIPTTCFKTKYDIVTRLPFEKLGYTSFCDEIELSTGFEPHEILNNHSIQTYIAELEKYMV